MLIISDALVEVNAQGRVFNKLADIPARKVGLLLGTSKYSVTGPNLFYKARINAAVSLYESGKVKYILISGDNGTRYYNEPKQFLEDLLKRGVPRDRIVLDYAGFRTLDSVVRAKEVFEEEEIIIISQQFHVERALFIADKRGVDAVGFNAEDVTGQRGLKTKVRERFARLKMMWDLIIRKQPKFLGEKIPIG